MYWELYVILIHYNLLFCFPYLTRMDWGNDETVFTYCDICGAFQNKDLPSEISGS